MVTVVNNPSGGDKGTGLGIVLGVIIAILVILFIAIYGLPALRRDQPQPQQNPGIKVDVTLPKGDGNTPTPNQEQTLPEGSGKAPAPNQ